MFVEKLNKRQDGSTYVIEEEKLITEGIYEGYLEHDNITGNTIKVFTGSKLTGDEIVSVIISKPSETPWKTYIKVFAGVDKVYISYETTGDTVEAEDINLLQDAAQANQDELNRYEETNDVEVNLLKGRMNVVEVSKANEVSVAERLLTKSDKTNTYTKDETDQRIKNVVAAAPAALDTLKELADALNNDPGFAATMTTQLAAKVDKVSGKGLSTEDYSTAEKTKLTGMEAGAEVNNISDTNAALLTGSADTSLHYHSSDRNRANHTGSQPASTISDFAAAVRSTVLSGLSTATSSIITVTDSVLTALGRLQAQITANLAALTAHTGNVSNPHSVTKAQVGLGNCDNTADASKNVLGAAKLTTARTINLSGGISGTAAFDGSSDISITTAVADDSHNHIIANIDNLQTALDAKAPVSHASTANTYGLGTTANYGHVKTINALTQSTHADGTALSAYQGYVLNSALANKAPLASPALSGSPTAPTAAAGTNTTQIATTAFVQQEISAAGYDDMQKAVYDTDGDGMVDVSGTALKLQTARAINLAGSISGSAAFDGSSNISITAIVADDSHNHVIANIDNLQAALDAKTPTSHASAANTYGLGTTANYGHVKTINALTQSSHADGTALSAYQGYVLNSALTNKAPLASPTLTGTPTAPTAIAGTNTTQLATTAFVQQELSAAGNGDMLKATYDADGDGIVDASEAAVKLQTVRTIAISGGATGTATGFDGSSNITIPVTSLDATKLSGTAAVSITGNAATATKLAAARTITVAGNISGSASFDGSSNISITSSLIGPITWGQLKGA